MKHDLPGKIDHVKDDAILQEKTAVLNELHAKKQAVIDEIAECEKRLLDFSAQLIARDAVTDALEIDIGVPVPQHISNEHVKLTVLRNQFNKLTRAIQIQHEIYFREAKNAGYRVFAQNHSQYMAHGHELLKAVDHVIAITTVRLKIKQNQLVIGRT